MTTTDVRDVHTASQDAEAPDDRPFLPYDHSVEPSYEAHSDLQLANWVLVIAMGIAAACPMLRKILEIHSSIPHYGYIWVAWALLTATALRTPWKKIHDDIAAANTVTHKYGAAGFSLAISAFLWFVPSILSGLGIVG